MVVLLLVMVPVTVNAPEKVVVELPLSVLAAPDKVYVAALLPELNVPLLVKLPGKVMLSLLVFLNRPPLLMVTSLTKVGAVALRMSRVPEIDVVVAIKTLLLLVKNPLEIVKVV